MEDIEPTSKTKKDKIKALKTKLEKYKKDNEFLKKNLNETIDQIKKIKENVQFGQNLYDQMQEVVKKIQNSKYIINNENNTADTAIDSYNIETNKKEIEDKSVNAEKIQKIEAVLEFITGKYQKLKEKFEILKYDYSIAENTIDEQRDEILALNTKYNNINKNHNLHEDCNKRIEGLKELNKCLIKQLVYTIPREKEGDNNKVYSEEKDHIDHINNIEEYVKDLSLNKEDDNIDIFNEPMPSLFTFFSKYT